jgi:hypothetical protein
MPPIASQTLSTSPRVALYRTPWRMLPRGPKEETARRFTAFYAARSKSHYTSPFPKSASGQRRSLSSDARTSFPRGYGFHYVEPADRYDPDRLYQGSCVATRPTLLISDGTPPWTLTATELFESVPGAASATAASEQIHSVTVAASDVLVATAALVRYVVSSGTTCAPNCASPSNSGDPRPLPTAPPDDRPPLSGDGGLDSGSTAIILVSVMGGVVFFAFLLR